MRKFLRVLIPLTVLILVVVAFKYAFPRYDQLVAEREAVRREWAQIDTLLQRRYDLIPNLVQTVQGYVRHEEKVLLEMADAHTGYQKARSINEKIDAAYQAERGIRQCYGWGIRYPQLGANQVFLQLMKSLEKTEDQVSQQRMSYNTAVGVLNADVQTLWGGLVSRVGGFQQMSYYNPPTEVEGVPEVVQAEDGSGRVNTRMRVAASEDSAEPQMPPSVRDLKLTGFVEGAREGSIEEVILQFPDGQFRQFKRGDQILELRARVLSFDRRGVVFEERSLDANGRSVTKQVRVSKSGG